ncbi:hypothetical protein FS842_006149 [Serendipita sp. 407]|nr:hypothetical protein FS842_006149 [Serendipita sp. 407]
MWDPQNLLRSRILQSENWVCSVRSWVSIDSFSLSPFLASGLTGLSSHYTTATSSKSDSYSTNGSTSSYKAIIMTKVVVGRGYKMTQNAQTLTAPPTGFHSVLGEPVQGGKLNYDELVVYDNDAIRPAYLIVY